MEHIGKEPNTHLLHPARAGLLRRRAESGAPYTIAGDFVDRLPHVRRRVEPHRMTFSVDGNAFFTVDQGHDRDDPWAVGLRPPVLPHPQQRGRR